MALKRTYGSIYFQDLNKRWIIPAAEPHVCIKLKNVFQGISKYKTVPFDFPALPEVASELKWFMSRYPLVISSKDLARLNKLTALNVRHLSDMERIMMPDYELRELSLNEGLAARKYQLQGAELFHFAKRMILGDDIGLGKTLTAILHFLYPGTLPAAVVMQTHMQDQWDNQIKKFTNLSTHIIKGTKPYSLPQADVYLFKYSQLLGWIDFFVTSTFRTGVFDECQELRRNESGKYSSAKQLSLKVKWCLGMSATPIYNYGEEIFNILDLINQGCLGQYNQFMEEWTKWTGSVQDPSALGSFLREQHLMLRRTRSEVGRELPPVNTLIQPVEYDESVVASAADLARTLAIKATSGSFVERGQAARELDALARQVTGVSKARHVAAFVKILLDSGEPILLAGWHREVYKIWAEAFADYNPVFYTGSESDKQKGDAKEKFISGQTNLMIISLRSGVGLDGLQHRCKLVVIGELDWSPKVHEQLIGRVDRDGNMDQVTAIFCVSEYGSDPIIVDICGLKAQEQHGIINPFEPPKAKYSDESKLRKLAEIYLSKNFSKN